MRKNTIVFFISIMMILSYIPTIKAQNINPIDDKPVNFDEYINNIKDLNSSIIEIETIIDYNPMIYYYYDVDGFYYPCPKYYIESIKLHNPAYGEDNQLDQFTDNFENETFISVKENVIRNSTLNCIELLEEEQSTYSDDIFQLREHKNYASYSPAWVYSITSSAYVRQYSTSVAMGASYMFLVINTNYINGKYIRWRWRQYDSHSAPGVIVGYSWMFDGGYDRTSSTHFPSGSGLVTMGNGIIQTLGSSPRDTSWSDWEIEDWLIDVDGASLENVTFMMRVHDSWNSALTGLEVDWVEINSDSGGSDNIATFDFDESTNIVMEKTGTTGDYGYVNNTGLPISTGGYDDDDGYMITDNYLDYINGSSLVLMTNSTVPIYTYLTVQFSDDNMTWVNNKNVAGYNTVVDGFSSIDLRNINSTDIYMMYNFTGNTEATPRLYQSRLISTGGVGGGGEIIYVKNYWILYFTVIIAILLSTMFLSKYKRW